MKGAWSKGVHSDLWIRTFWIEFLQTNRVAATAVWSTSQYLLRHFWIMCFFRSQNIVENNVADHIVTFDRYDRVEEGDGIDA